MIDVKEENTKHGKSLLNLKVSGDGFWKTHGFFLLFGVTLIKNYTGRIIDHCKGQLLPVMYVLEK